VWVRQNINVVLRLVVSFPSSSQSDCVIDSVRGTWVSMVADGNTFFCEFVFVLFVPFQSTGCWFLEEEAGFRPCT